MVEIVLGVVSFMLALAVLAFIAVTAFVAFTALVALVAFVAVPDKVPVIIFALKFPEPSLNTKVFAVLLEVAEVRVFVAA